MKGRPFFMSVPGATIHGQSITKLQGRKESSSLSWVEKDVQPGYSTSEKSLLKKENQTAGWEATTETKEELVESWTSCLFSWA